MKNEDISKLVEEFVRRVKLYEAKYGRDDFWKACIHTYTDELQDWHELPLGGSENPISEQRKTLIANTLLDAIGYMSKRNIKEQFIMKKSELKALIREVVDEAQSLEKAIGYKEPYSVGIVEKLTAENKKLREALQEIRSDLSTYVHGDEELAPWRINQMLDTADKVLSGK